MAKYTIRERWNGYVDEKGGTTGMLLRAFTDLLGLGMVTAGALPAGVYGTAAMTSREDSVPGRVVDGYYRLEQLNERLPTDLQKLEAAKTCIEDRIDDIKAIHAELQEANGHYHAVVEHATKGTEYGREAVSDFDFGEFNPFSEYGPMGSESKLAWRGEKLQDAGEEIVAAGRDAKLLMQQSDEVAQSIQDMAGADYTPVEEAIEVAQDYYDEATESVEAVTEHPYEAGTAGMFASAGIMIPIALAAIGIRMGVVNAYMKRYDAARDHESR